MFYIRSRPPFKIKERCMFINFICRHWHDPRLQVRFDNRKAA
jgi:hypothetical protein